MRTLICMFAMALCMGVAAAADAPDFRGPERDGKFPASGLLKAWPEGGPPVAWTAEGIGEGYASVSVVGDTIYVPGMLGENDGYLFLLDKSGAITGKIPYGEETLDKQAPGPRSTPTIRGDRAYLISGPGVVICFDLAARKVLWTVDMKARFGAKDITWAIAESPLVLEEHVICTPGGPGGLVAALDRQTGATAWACTDLDEASAYCSPDLLERGGRRVIVTMTAKHVIGVDAAAGKLLWKHPHETDYDIHATTPVFADGMLYYTAGYRSGGGMLALSSDASQITPKWTDDNLDCQHHGVVLLDGYIYGSSHGSRKGFVCLELATGKMMWNTREVTQGATVYADGMLYVYEGPKRGRVSLLEATPEGYRPAGQVEVTQGTGKHWAHPAIAHQRLYIRHGNALIAYDIAAQ